MKNIELVSPCSPYRDKSDTESETDYAERLAKELEESIIKIGAENVSVFILETVVGSTSGATPPVKSYLKKIKKVCSKYDVLLVLDEVMCGLGRTGYHYSYLEDDVLPDIVAVGKGLAAGYQPISAVLISDKVNDALVQGSGVLESGQTYTNHPLACSVALEVQKVIDDESLLDNVLMRGKQLKMELASILSDCEHVGDVRGRGLFVGVEIVPRKDTKEPYAGGAQFAQRLKEAGMHNELLLYPGFATVHGLSRILSCPSSFLFMRVRPPMVHS